MAKTEKRTDIDDLISRASRDADALGQLYELYYERIFRFCVHRLFYREDAEDVTSTVFLNVARKIGKFRGQTKADFTNWIYAIAANHANAHIRKKTRRSRLFEKAASTIVSDSCKGATEPDWPTLYKAVLKLKPENQTIVTLRFFEDMEFEQIAKIVNAPAATVRVKLHRILKKLRNYLHSHIEAEK